MKHLSRRTVLISLSAASLLPACRGGSDSGTITEATPTRDPEPDPWVPDGTEDQDTFPWGVQVGDATDSAAILSVETTATSLTLVVMQGADGAWVEVDRQEGLTPEDGHLQIELTDLSADTAWSVVFYDTDGTRSAPTRFRSALAAADTRVVVFGAVSCLGSNKPWPSLSQAAAERYDFFCLLGDTVYADGSTTSADYQWHWNGAMTTAGMRDLCGSTGLIATWDDHEVDNNWSWQDTGIEQQFETALDWFGRALPRRSGQGIAGIWRKLSWGGTLDVFVLECRAERVPEDGVYLSAEQLDWLKTGLSASTARFKIILNSVPITDFFDAIGSLAEEDRWSGFPEQREEILSHAADIPGVLWISGDLHWGSVSAVDPEGGVAAAQREVMVGPGGSFLNIAADLVVNRDQYPILFATWNTTRFSCDPGTGVIAVSFIGDDGAILHELDIQL
ncbi:MAG: alkaline phosphatase D [Myxococcota bacterium]|jgi:alkaline phosphatase D